ncbi:hypothetical protein BDV12DRAFT_167661 [Aspergillus spectabilis]
MAKRLLIPSPESRMSVSTGTVESMFTEPGNQADRYVDASEENPRDEIEDVNTSKLTTVYEASIFGQA